MDNRSTEHTSQCLSHCKALTTPHFQVLTRGIIARCVSPRRTHLWKEKVKSDFEGLWNRISLL